MKRDLDLQREILLAIEEHNSPTSPVNLDELCPDDTDYPDINQIRHEVALLEEAGLIVCFDLQPLKGIKPVQRLTNKGHDYLDTVRDPEIWAETKRQAMAAGGWTLKLLGDLAEGFIKTNIKKLTGVDL